MEVAPKYTMEQLVRETSLQIILNRIEMSK